MRPVSDRFLRTVRGSHKISTRAKILTDFQTGVQPTGIEIPVFDGSVSFDATSDVLARLDGLETLADFSEDSDLTPYGNEVFVERIVHYGDASSESVSLGYYRINTSIKDPVTTGSIQLTGSDRMAQIIDSRLPTARSFPPGTLLEDIFEELIKDVYPHATIEFDHMPGAFSIARTHVAERDRYKFLRDLATARGLIFYFDHRGILVLKELPTATNPVFNINAGEDGVLVSAAHEMSREQVYNGVVAFGEGTDDMPPVSALVVDNNHLSKTYWFGRFGKIPRFFFSSFLETEEQCVSAATKILLDAVNLPYRIDLTMSPNYALEPRDLVSINSPGQPQRIQAIQTLNIPFSVSRPIRIISDRKITAEQIEIGQLKEIDT